MTNRSGLRRALGELGELLESHRGDDADLSAYEGYADDPSGFLREVLSADPWHRQAEIAEAVRDEPLVSVRSCHAAGKDWLAARLALWWCYARRGLVLLTGPTRVQVKEILMRGELREAFTQAGGLPGDLHVKALRPTGRGKAGVLAKTATGVSALTGFHDARVLFVITEAQDPEIGHAWDAAFACTTGAEDRVLTLGNPTEPVGRFYQAHRESSEWRSFRITADDIPNVREGRTVVPGLLTREGVRRFADEYGEDSGFYRSRVLAAFPEEGQDALVQREWIDAAVDRWDELREPKGEPVVAVDPARFGVDRTALVVCRGGHVGEVETWSGADTMETVGKVQLRLRELGVEPERVPKRSGRVGPYGRPPRYTGLAARHPAVGAVVVDEIGVGGGVVDRLREQGFEVVAFNGGASAKGSHSDRFLNRRAQAFWTLRKALEEGRVALPPNQKLRGELVATRWSVTSAGHVRIEPKDELRQRLGRSPDRADAVSMAVWKWELMERQQDMPEMPAHVGWKDFRM